MAEKTLLIIQEKQNDLKELKTDMENYGFTIVGETFDGEKGVEIALKKEPQFIVTGLILETIDGLDVLSKLRKAEYKGDIVVISAIINDEIIKKVMDLGALYFMAKPAPKESINARLQDLFTRKDKNVKKNEKEEKRDLSVDEKISKIFISVGIPPHIKGYNYLREGVKMAIQDPAIINSITKKLYPGIGEKYDTSASKVERAIRHAIEVAWNRNRIDSINSVFGVRAYVGSDKPTNGEFIALVADKMLLEGA